MTAVPQASGARLASRVPLVSAVVAAVSATVAVLIPVVTSRSASRDQAVADAHGAVDRAADLGREEIRGWFADRMSELDCLASDPHFEAEAATAIALVEPEDNERVADEEASRTEEEAAAARAALEKLAGEAKVRVLDRLKAFREARPACKRVLIAHKSSIVVISTETSDENGSLGGSLVSSALEAPAPISHVSTSLAEQFGGPAVVAVRSAQSKFVIIAAYEMAEVFGPLQKIGPSLGETGRVLLTDGRAQPVLGGPTKAGGKTLEIEPLTKAIKGQSGIATTSDEAGKLVLAAYRPVPQASLALVVMQQLEDIEGQSAPIPLGAILGSLALALLGAVVIVILGRKSLQGLGALAESAGRVAAGDLSERAPVTGDDDVSFIARTFNDVLAKAQAGGGSRPSLPPEPKPSTPSPEPKAAGPGPSDRSLALLRERLLAADDRHGLASGLLDVVWSHGKPAAVAVYVRDPATRAYTVLASRGMDPDRVHDLTSGQGAAGRCAATGQSVVNATLSDEEARRLAASAKRSGLAQVTLPMKNGAEVLGVLEVIGEGVDPGDTILGLAADAAALALSLLNEQTRAAKLAEQAERLLTERDGGD